MIKLTEILWPPKGSIEFTEREVFVEPDRINYMACDRMVLSAPSEIACKIFRGKIPDHYYREVGARDCTTIHFSDGTSINIKETPQEIDKLKLMANSTFPKLLDAALDFIVETQEDNDLICEQMPPEYCETRCNKLCRECVIEFLTNHYEKKCK